jgi:hypothetical protein
MNASNIVPLNDNQDSPELTWEEHSKLLTRAFFSWRIFGMAFGISILLAFTVGIVFQTVFIFSVFQGFLMLARISQPFYSAFLSLAHAKELPPKLAKPPLSAILASIVPLLISAFWVYLGFYVFRITGFCPQSLGCIIITLIRSIGGS